MVLICRTSRVERILSGKCDFSGEAIRGSSMAIGIIAVIGACWLSSVMALMRDSGRIPASQEGVVSARLWSSGRGLIEQGADGFAGRLIRKPARTVASEIACVDEYYQAECRTIMSAYRECDTGANIELSPGR
jgi:hypothetical protein